MNRLTKPIMFLLISSTGLATVLSLLLLVQESSHEVIKEITLIWTPGIVGINLNLSLFIDKLSSRHGEEFNWGVRYYKGRSIILWDTLRDFES